MVQMEATVMYRCKVPDVWPTAGACRLWRCVACRLLDAFFSRPGRFLLVQPTCSYTPWHSRVGQVCW
jgi:hypothetical protein